MSIARPGITKPLPSSIQRILADSNWVRTGVHAEGTCFFHSWATSINKCHATDQQCGQQFRVEDIGNILNKTDWDAFWKQKNVVPIPSYKKAEETIPAIRGKKAWAYDALIVYCLEKKGYNYIFFDARAGKPFCGIFGTLKNKPTVVILWLQHSHFEPMGYREKGHITYLFPPSHPQIKTLTSLYRDSCPTTSLRNIVGGENGWKAMLKVLLHLEEATYPVGTVILFYRPGCRYCQEFLPMYNAVMQDHPDTMKKVNIDLDGTAKDRYDFSTVPTIVRIEEDGFVKMSGERSMENTRLFVGGGDAVVYTYIVHPSATSLTAFIQETMQDPRGWKGMGYDFQQVEEQQQQEADIHVHLISNATIVSQFTNKFDGLSVCYTEEMQSTIYLNRNNWDHPPAAFTGTKTAYQQYVLQHEFGHAIGMDHTTTVQKNGTCHPMSQQTLGTSRCTPNPWIMR